MRKCLLWLLLSCKRYMKRPAFLLLLLLLPSGAWFFGKEEKASENGIRIAVFAEEGEEDSFDQRLVEKLVSYKSGEEGMFSFYRADSLEELKEDVATRRAECGYVIGKGLEEKLANKKLRNAIRLYEAPSTVAGQLSTETFFSLMIEEYDRILFLDYLRNGGLFSEEVMDEDWLLKADQEYQRIQQNGSTFHFTYREEAQEREIMTDPSGQSADLRGERTIFPVRGFAAVFIFITGLYGAVTLGQDERRGLFFMLSGAERIFCRLASILAPVLLAALSGLGALWASGEFISFGRELLPLLAYCLLTASFAMGIKRVTGKEGLLCSLIPFFMVGSLIFCPVFLDVGRYVKGAGWIGRLFLPYYYLTWF